MEFAILHVAVDNDVFAKLPRFCSLDHSFWYRFVCSSTCRSASKAHRKSSLRAFAENHFLTLANSWAYEQHRTCTKLKGSLKNRLLLASYAQNGAIGYPCDSGSGNTSRPVCVDWPGHDAFPSDDSRLKCFKSV